MSLRKEMWRTVILCSTGLVDRVMLSYCLDLISEVVPNLIDSVTSMWVSLKGIPSGRARRTNQWICPYDFCVKFSPSSYIQIRVLLCLPLFVVALHGIPRKCSWCKTFPGKQEKEQDHTAPTPPLVPPQSCGSTNHQPSTRFCLLWSPWAPLCVELCVFFTALCFQDSSMELSALCSEAV